MSEDGPTRIVLTDETDVDEAYDLVESDIYISRKTFHASVDVVSERLGSLATRGEVLAIIIALHTPDDVAVDVLDADGASGESSRS